MRLKPLLLKNKKQAQKMREGFQMALKRKKSFAAFIFVLLFAYQGLAQKPRTDREDEGVRGQVQKIVIEKAKLSRVDGKWVESGRELSEVITFDASGDRVKRENFDKAGLLETEVYTYLEGDRVMKRETAPGRVLPGGAGPSRDPSRPRDPRYSIKFKYKYDPQGNRVEVMRLRSDGALASRSVRVYDAKGNGVEESFYDSNGSRYTKVTSIYDDRGNITEESDDLGIARFNGRYSYIYEFDVHGNWTKRITSEWITKGGKSFFEPYYVTYRTITYY